jgi:hypothetical protein
MQTESSSRAAPAPAGSHWQHYDPCSGLTRASSGCLVSNAEDLRRATAAVAGKRGSGRILPPRGPPPAGSRWQHYGGRDERWREQRAPPMQRTASRPRPKPAIGGATVRRGRPGAPAATAAIHTPVPRALSGSTTYGRTLLRPSRCADRLTPARLSGQPGRGERAKRPQKRTAGRQ